MCKYVLYNVRNSTFEATYAWIKLSNVLLSYTLYGNALANGSNNSSD